MNHFLKILTVFLVIMWPFRTALGGQLAWHQAIVIQVIDGDTIQVSKGNQTATVRLWGIDAPEWDQPFSKGGKSFLTSLILGKKIEVQYYYTDDYGRLIAQIRYNRKNVNELLIKKGYAWVYSRYCDRPICSSWKNSEKIARLNKKGLWKDDNPISPWQWKWKKKE